MVLLHLHDVALILGSRTIFDSLHWEIKDQQKIGLIGSNGTGKSSLFKVIMGEMEAEIGSQIIQSKGLSVGYLAQQPQLNEGQTALACAMDGNERWSMVHEELTIIENNLADPAVYGDETVLTCQLGQQQMLVEEYMELGGDQYPQRVEQMLLGLGLPAEQFEKPISALSGGQKKLVGLARLLISQPDLLLLDEPDNHLDLNGKLFLEKWIRDYNGAVVLVSHDRYLLDAVVTDIAELEDGTLTIFHGDYSEFVFEKELRLQRQQEMFQVQQKQIARIEAAIKRYAIWAKTYDNEKFAKRASSIQKRLDKMERVDKPILERKRMDLQLNGWRGSNKVLDYQRVTKRFKQQIVLHGLDLTLFHGERVGVIGANGSGKSVLLRLAAGIMDPDEGEVVLGPSINSGYYAQEHETLDIKQTLIDCVQRAGRMSEGSAVSFLKKYLFTYRQASQKIGQLSGGERSRLQLALIVLSGANLLLLDEPTNNLDIQSAEVLEDSLNDFEGTVLVVSHDRYFLDRVVDRILVVDNGHVTGYLGGYSEYLERKRTS
jgi:ATP-binding cassette subfamily F protein 3